MFDPLDVAAVTHVATSPGAGGTTILLQHSRVVLQAGGRVLWLARALPDGDRMAKMFGDIQPAAIARFHAGAFGQQLHRGLESAHGMIDSLATMSLVIVDDWAERSGRTSTISKAAIADLIERCGTKGIPIMVSSSMYGDASGRGEWRIRGEETMASAGAEIWLLTRGEGGRRILNRRGMTTLLTLTDQGFSDESIL